MIERIRAAMARLGLTQYDVACICNMSPTTARRLVRDGILPTAYDIRARVKRFAEEAEQAERREDLRLQP